MNFQKWEHFSGSPGMGMKNLEEQSNEHKTTVKIGRTIVIPVMSYGSGSWALNKTDERKIEAFEICA